MEIKTRNILKLELDLTEEEHYNLLVIFKTFSEIADELGITEKHPMVGFFADSIFHKLKNI